jgi:hypothetical protein
MKIRQNVYFYAEMTISAKKCFLVITDLESTHIILQNAMLL